MILCSGFLKIIVTVTSVLVKGQWGHRNPGLKIETIGRFDWRRRSGYYLQSHVENAFYRFKRIIGGQLRSKNSEAQEREALVGCTILNRMLEIGRPVSYRALRSLSLLSFLSISSSSPS